MNNNSLIHIPTHPGHNLLTKEEIIDTFVYCNTIFEQILDNDELGENIIDRVRKQKEDFNVTSSWIAVQAQNIKMFSEDVQALFNQTKRTSEEEQEFLAYKEDLINKIHGAKIYIPEYKYIRISKELTNIQGLINTRHPIWKLLRKLKTIDISKSDISKSDIDRLKGGIMKFTKDLECFHSILKDAVGGLEKLLPNIVQEDVIKIWEIIGELCQIFYKLPCMPQS